MGDVLFPSLLAAVGLGFSFVPVTIAAMSNVEDREAGLACGLINTSQQVGGALGLAILSSVAFSSIAGATDPATLTEGYADAFMVGAGIAVLGVIASLTLIRGERLEGAHRDRRRRSAGRCARGRNRLRRLYSLRPLAQGRDQEDQSPASV